MKKSRFTDSQILAVLKQAEAGTRAPQQVYSYLPQPPRAICMTGGAPD